MRRRELKARRRAFPLVDDTIPSRQARASAAHAPDRQFLDAASFHASRLLQVSFPARVPHLVSGRGARC